MTAEAAGSAGATGEPFERRTITLRGRSEPVDVIVLDSASLLPPAA